MPIAAAETGRVVTPLGKTLDGWLAKGPIAESGWAIGVAKVDPSDEGKLKADPLGDATPEFIRAGGHGSDLYTKEKFGDCTVEVELMVPKGSNSGIYLMGEYEIQVLDSFGRERVGPGDIGGLYGAKAPALNAAKAPGEWQKFVIEFVAPRFEGDKKVGNARFVKVTLNDQVIHENVEMKGQTPGGVAGREAAQGPLMFQGNHGAVAYRNLKITLPKQ
ncbi:MAG: DUF1080 domain-containing protein [Candidatus Nealsonbacteria bacterium]|nr:DUF1080 domain-containing protein [Candidatus Nealsonbacteria bacterium]